MPKEGKERIIRSEEVQDILSAPPHALLRMGSAVIGGVLLVLLVGCVVFRYPDTIPCTVTITKTEPPVWIVAKATGRLQELYVGDQQPVQAGEIIAVVENPAHTQDVLTLDSILNNSSPGIETTIDISLREAHLGNIQGSYASLAKAATDLNNFVCNNLYDQRIAAEEAQLRPYADYVRSVEKQVGYSQRINALNATNYQREKALHDRGLTAAADLESTEQSLLGSSMSAEQMQSSLATAKIQMAQIRNTISELRLQREQEKHQLETALLAAWENTRAAIQEWKQTYVLQSPITGVVAYNNLWKTNQNINAGDKAFSVLNSKGSATIGKAKIPVAGSGKIKTGQRINIRLDGYPYLEYGFLTGSIRSVAAMPDDDFYTATFELPEGALTSYGQSINKEGDLSGVGEIVTDNLSVAERLVAPLRYLLHRSVAD